MKIGLNFPEQLLSQGGFFSRIPKIRLEESRSWQEYLGNFRRSERAKEISSWRLLGAGFVFLGLLLLLVFKLWGLQIISGRKNLILSMSNRILIEVQKAPRGVIYDRSGTVLARNAPGFRATLTFSLLPDEGDEKREERIKNIAALLSLAEDNLHDILDAAAQSPERPITLKNNLDHETLLKIEALEQEMPGIKIEEDVVRFYPKKEVLAHLLGYPGQVSRAELKRIEFKDYSAGDLLGRDGLERTYEEVLRGRDGERLIEVDAAGLFQKELASNEALAGNNLVLSVDIALQEKAVEILAEFMKKYQATGGVFIAQEVKTGQILALVSLPSFDNNFFASGQFAPVSSADSSGSLFDRAVTGQYPPGSIIKPLVAAAALEQGVITEKTHISDEPQVIQIGPWQFPDWTVSWGRGAHGFLTVKEAIAQSCDIFFYKIGGGYPPYVTSRPEVRGLGIDKLKSALKLFGFGERLGVDLPAESRGLVPDPIWKEKVKNEAWFLGNTYHLAIGQGDLLTTPLQIVNYISAIANGGKLFKPRLVKRIEDENGKLIKDHQPEVLRENLIDSVYLKVVGEGMRLAVTDGIVYPLRTLKTPIAAKTGTAEFGTPNAQGILQTHAWVTGFAPFEDPEISFVLLLESGGPSSRAAEAAAQILKWYFKE